MKKQERVLAELTDSIKWHTGIPEESGYYLIAWINKFLFEQVNVSEAWFNPDSIMPWWWSRGYTGEPRRYGVTAAVTQEVVAWAKIPNPPTIIK